MLNNAAKNRVVAHVARQWILGGRVQGVGFRPFVYRMALRCGVQGWVRNRGGEVVVMAQGAPEMLQRFGRALLTESPPLARPEILSESTALPELSEEFQIRSSEAAGPAQAHVPPDYFACDDCLAELNNSSDRRFRYPFINCTQCGPRYTLINRLPYDRVNTSMACFPLCPLCAAEYEDPGDRRFHAEPIACPQCGPCLEFRVDGKQAEHGANALSAAVVALQSGKIVAVKGIGGYHLLCDARSSGAVITLRSRKRRP